MLVSSHRRDGAHTLFAIFQMLRIVQLPPLLLGVVLSAYWGRVLRMAYKARRRSGRAANLVPGEKLGRVLRIVWGPVIGIWVAHPFASALMVRLPLVLRSIFPSSWIAWPALLVAIVCWMLSRICWRAMGRNWRMGIDPTEQNSLVVAGPFSRVRHPIYALSILMMLASMIIIPSPLMLGAGIIHITLLVWESVREDRHLLGVHGIKYQEYQKRTGAFFPKW